MMHFNKFAIAVLLPIICGLLVSSNAFSTAHPKTTSSADAVFTAPITGSPSTPPHGSVKCPHFIINTTVATSTPQLLFLGGEQCIPSGIVPGGIALDVMVGGGTFTPNCPADHPYLGAYTEDGGGAFPAPFYLNFSVDACCTGEQAPFSVVSNGTTWVSGLNPTCP